MVPGAVEGLSATHLSWWRAFFATALNVMGRYSAERDTSDFVPWDLAIPVWSGYDGRHVTADGTRETISSAGAVTRAENMQFHPQPGRVRNRPYRRQI